MEELLIICMPVCIIATGFLVLKSVQLGLKWQSETKQGKEPTLDINPVKPIVEAVQHRQEVKAVNLSKDIHNEWMYGG